MSNATDLLKRVVENLDEHGFMVHGTIEEFCRTLKEIRAYLDAELEAEPAAWTNQDELNALGTDATCYMYSELMAGENNIPLYTISKPTSKPLTSNERLQGFIELRDNDDGVHLLSFLAGVRLAEKHHGIIPRCENS